MRDYYEPLAKIVKIHEQFGDGFREKTLVEPLPVAGYRHRCESCGELVDSIAELIRHELTKHKERNVFGCGDCERQFDAKLDFVRHKRLFCEGISKKLRDKRIQSEVDLIKASRDKKRQKERDRRAMIKRMRVKKSEAQQKRKTKKRSKKLTNNKLSSSEKTTSENSASSDVVMLDSSDQEVGVKKPRKKLRRKLTAIVEESTDEDGDDVNEHEEDDVIEANVVSMASPAATAPSTKPKKPLTPLKKPKQSSILGFFGKKK